MKKLGMLCLGAAFLSVCMMESHGFVFALPALIFGGLSVIVMSAKDKPRRAKNKICDEPMAKEEAA